MWETRICYGDTDAGKVVYYGNYLLYFEKSWFECLAAKGLSLAEYEKEGIYFIVKKVAVEYYFPARYGDIICVETDITDVTRATFSFHHRVTLKATGKLLVEGTNQMVCVKADGKPQRLPTTFIDRLKHT